MNYLGKRTDVEIRSYSNREDHLATYVNDESPSYNLITHIMLYYKNKKNHILDPKERLKVQQEYNIVDLPSRQHNGLSYAYCLELDLISVEKTIRD